MKTLPSILATGILLYATTGAVVSQKKPSIGNLELSDAGRKFYIRYDIVDSDADSAHIIDFYVVDNIGRVVVPDSVSGDVGPGVPGMTGREIVWDIYSEFDVVHGNFDPSIRIDGREGYTIKGGPWFALLSVTVPGLGDYFVEEYKKMRIKPWMRTAGALGFVGLGILCSEKRTWTPPTWVDPYEKIGWHIQDRNFVYGPYWVDGYYADRGHHNYWLFRWDSEVFFTTGIAIWAMDIIWVYVKGRRNSMLDKKLNLNFSMGYIDRSPVYSYTLTFNLSGE